MRTQSPHAGWAAPPGRVSCTTSGSVVMITLSGEVDLLLHDDLEAAMATAVAAQPADVAVDLATVTFIGSQALSFLVRLHHLTADRSRLTTLQRVPQAVRKVMVTVGLDLVFPLEETPTGTAGDDI